MAGVSQLLLHTLVIKGFCSEDAAADATGLPVETVTKALAELGDQGLARHREGRISGWSPTPAGRAEHRASLDGVLAPDDPAVVHDVYGRFATLNTAFKHVCTDWQVRGTAPNDHGDAAYDRAVISRLLEIHAQVLGLCAELHPALPRIDRYRDRLESALRALQAGDRDRFTRPLSGSYHDVWMELHQDLLATLGLSRTAADA